MTLRTLIGRSLRFHWRGQVGVVLGAAIGSAALIGALVVFLVGVLFSTPQRVLDEAQRKKLEAQSGEDKPLALRGRDSRFEVISSSAPGTSAADARR